MKDIYHPCQKQSPCSVQYLSNQIPLPWVLSWAKTGKVSKVRLDGPGIRSPTKLALGHKQLHLPSYMCRKHLLDFM